MARKAGDKLPTVEHIQYVLHIYSMLLVGNTRADIIRYAYKMGSRKRKSGLSWNISSQTIDNMLKEAKQMLYKEANEDAKQFRAKSKKRLALLFKKALENKTLDLAEARRIIETENKVLGYEKMTVEHKGDVIIKLLDEHSKDWFPEETPDNGK